MSKKKKKENAAQYAAPVSAQTNTKKTKATTTSTFPFEKFLLPLLAFAITFIAFSPALKNAFVNWDDPGYVYQNGSIADLSSKGIKYLLTAYQMGNYHPLTMLSYALEFAAKKLNPALYHFDNILIHCLTVILCFLFVKKITGNKITALITAVLFGVQTMHTESVAWVSERKDVLFGFFFMASLHAYLFYRDDTAKKWMYYALSMVLFVCSLLSKAVAVPLPVVLLLVDYFQGRKWNMKVLAEKIPMLVLSLIFGIISIKAQQDFSAIELGDKDYTYTFIERIFLASFALFTYLWKAVAPMYLSCFYPYPLKESGSLPLEYFIYLPVILILGFLVWRFGRKNKALLFGLGFFILTIALLLQLLPVGSAIVADRYAYIGYFGLCFIAADAVTKYIKKNQQQRMIVMVLVVAYTGFLGYLTYQRCQVWKDTITLWTDAIEKYPKLPHAWNNRGFEYYEKNDYDLALADFNKAIELNPNFEKPYTNRGEIYRNTGKYAEAEASFNKALSLNDKTYEAYLGRAILYSIAGRLDEAGRDFMKAIVLKPVFPEAHCSFGNYYDMRKQYDSAMYQYGLAIEQKPEFDKAYLNRAKAYFRLEKFKEALQDFNEYIRIKNDNAESYYMRAVCLLQTGDKAAAQSDAMQAQSMGYPVPPEFSAQLNK